MIKVQKFQLYVKGSKIPTNVQDDKKFKNPNTRQ
jgi:hypothetical protein